MRSFRTRYYFQRFFFFSCFGKLLQKLASDIQTTVTRKCQLKKRKKEKDKETGNMSSLS